jgi:uncharacterized protein YjlB
MDEPHCDSKNARDEPGTDRHAQFLRLYTRHQHRILAVDRGRGGDQFGGLAGAKVVVAG